MLYFCLMICFVCFFLFRVIVIHNWDEKYPFQDAGPSLVFGSGIPIFHWHLGNGFCIPRFFDQKNDVNLW